MPHSVNEISCTLVAFPPDFPDLGEPWGTMILPAIKYFLATIVAFLPAVVWFIASLLGGRFNPLFVLGVTALGTDRAAARARAYEAAADIDFAGMQFRSDIGA